uniref:Uncharacterized protein n=1 Tax=Noctiluca scintillans TaxID=2966 RepID=A0A7S1B2G4_NOCSC|mmetsp:Transcript_9239/g.25841  ORF Transcript_9239/g.25841 Transcript_9239/m.25841 type:complete len:509 (+) Transcript_9239:3-1529(+)|eukprot:CAMPEP_0194556772 /NCGR_PEP_ID=MMETSP0253-20130528/98912_1 /TAXON_ID=2966 /ORGANISM="Noctiluca scintillans" /LENGTH=508 /DNA_ID=CAMNT_0039404277 /DNA_START=1 /DNA_END=1530 /DNA_ORIENTATION=-
MVSLVVGGFLSGDDFNRVQGRHDIYRWLIAAHFMNHRSLSQHLGQFSEDDLVRSGVLSREEATIVMREAEEGSLDEEASTTTSPSRRSRIVMRPGVLVEEGAAERSRSIGSIRSLASRSPRISSFIFGGTHRLQASQYVKDECLAQQSRRADMSRCRDHIMWWIELRLQAAVKEKLMDKDKLKKSMVAVWGLRDSMEDLLSEGSRQQMFIWVVLMQLMVDLFVSLAPINVLGTQYHAHIWTLPCVFLRVWLVAFFYDSLMQITRILFNPFAVELDNLHLDPVLVLTERSIFANMALKEHHDLPEDLRELWLRVKEIPDEKEGKEGKDKKDKDTEKEKKDKEKKKQDQEKDTTNVTSQEVPVAKNVDAVDAFVDDALHFERSGMRGGVLARKAKRCITAPPQRVTFIDDVEHVLEDQSASPPVGHILGTSTAPVGHIQGASTAHARVNVGSVAGSAERELHRRGTRRMTTDWDQLSRLSGSSGASSQSLSVAPQHLVTADDVGVEQVSS